MNFILFWNRIPNNQDINIQTCSKGPRSVRPKNGPTKLAHIVMNYSCVVSLTETGMEIGDIHYIWGQNGVRGHSHTKNYIVEVYVCILLLYFSL